MGIPAIETPAAQRGDDIQRRLARLDRVVEQLRTLERSRNGAGVRGRELAEAVRVWEREATATRRRLAGSPRLAAHPDLAKPRSRSDRMFSELSVAEPR